MSAPDDGLLAEMKAHMVVARARAEVIVAEWPTLRFIPKITNTGGAATIDVAVVRTIARLQRRRPRLRAYSRALLPYGMALRVAGYQDWARRRHAP